jgi:dinuclear metal center YbgI/SA1388 family protein
MKINQIIHFVEEMAPLQIQEDYDNSGLIIGDLEKEIQGVLISLDVTEEVIYEAIRKGCDLIISHHPMIFKDVKRINSSTPAGRMINLAIRNDIALYSAHTNLDNTHGGVSWVFGKKLGLNNINVLSPKRNLLKKLVTFCPVDQEDRVRQALFDAGAGVIGNYDCCSFNLEGKGTFRGLEGSQPFVGEPGSLHYETETRIETIFPFYYESRVIRALLDAHPYDEVAYDIYPLSNRHPLIGSGITGEFDQEISETMLLEKVKTIAAIPFVRHSSLTGRKIRSVGFCGGSGRFLIPEAIGLGVDAFITADLSYHDFSEVDNKLLLVDSGHYESEQFSKEVIYNKLVEKIPNFVVLVSEINTNGVHYF